MKTIHFQFHHRDPGLVGLLTSIRIPQEKIVHYGIIADGVHTHPAALRIAHRTHPEGTNCSRVDETIDSKANQISVHSGLVLVTDAISALGLEEGFHQLGQLTIEVRARRAYIAGTDTLCGSIADMSECVRFFKEAAGRVVSGI